MTNPLQKIWNRIQQNPNQVSANIAIPASRVDIGASMGSGFQRDAHYFQVRISEMYLSKSREWFNKYDPLVFVVSEFIYDKETKTVPFIVGPTLVRKYGQKVPEGMIFANTRVAGIHPYRGGGLAFSAILCRVKQGNYAKELLRLVEKTASALDFSTALATYMKVAGVVIDGFETLFGLEDTEALIGIRQEFATGTGANFLPGYFALIDKPEAEIDVEQLWVRENKLVCGSSLAEARPFRDADYILYSFVQTKEREDDTTLPFYPLYERVKEAAAKPDKDSWKAAKANMFVLYESLAKSPDLSRQQISALTKRYVAEMREIHRLAVDLGSLGSGKLELSFLEESDISNSLDKAAVEILDLGI